MVLVCLFLVSLLEILTAVAVYGPVPLLLLFILFLFILLHTINRSQCSVQTRITVCVCVPACVFVCVSGLLASVPTIQEEAEPPMTDESQTSSGPGRSKHTQKQDSYFPQNIMLIIASSFL